MRLVPRLCPAPVAARAVRADSPPPYSLASPLHARQGAACRVIRFHIVRVQLWSGYSQGHKPRCSGTQEVFKASSRLLQRLCRQGFGHGTGRVQSAQVDNFAVVVCQPLGNVKLVAREEQVVLHVLRAERGGRCAAA